VTLGAKPIATAAKTEIKTEIKTEMMKKMFAAVALVSAAAVACGSKKATTTPAQPMETGATGGAAYGGAAHAGAVPKDSPPAGKGTPNPCAPK
jgi:hypothetical protein